MSPARLSAALAGWHADIPGRRRARDLPGGRPDASASAWLDAVGELRRSLEDLALTDCRPAHLHAPSPSRAPSSPTTPGSQRPRASASPPGPGAVAPGPSPLPASVESEQAASVESEQAASVESDQAARVELIAALERLKAAASAAQATLARELDDAQRRHEAERGVPADRRGRGVPLQVGLARGESPHRARTLLGAARVWATEMPHTFAALASGHLDEFRAVLLVRETACLPLEARAEVDRVVCADHESLRGVGTRRLLALARTCAARLDPASLVRRAARAEGERCVTVRPAPDAMVYLTALLPVAQGVGAYAALRAAADSARQAGDPRGRGQAMADTLVARLTGRSRADAVPVTVSLVISDRTLLGAGTDAAHLDGYGPVPAQVARHLVAAGLDAGAAWLRRVYTSDAGDLVAGSSTRRFHPPGLAALLRVRDQGLCRTPFCDAPAREADHVVAFEDGGETSPANGQGLCQACNLAKQAPGFSQHVEGGPGRHVVVTTTPTGHRYRSRAPAPPGASPPGASPPGAWPPGAWPPTAMLDRGPLSAVDLAFARMLAEAA